MEDLTSKQEKFAVKFVECNDKSEAYRHAYSADKMTKKSVNECASRISNNIKVKARIEELRSQSQEIAKEKFSISIERRLKWLEEIITAGLGTYIDSVGNNRRENLAAAKTAVDTINTMLGVGEDIDNKGDALSITFNVAKPVREIKVTKGE